MKKCIRISIFLTFVLLCVSTFFTAYGSSTITAKKSMQNLEVDGNAIVGAEFYNLDGYNYFKLRDLEYILKDTPQKIAVYFDISSNSVYINRGSYSADTASGLSKGAADSAAAIQSPQDLYIDGMSCDIKAYNINGFNYYKLADLAKNLGFRLDWINSTKTIQIYTENTYIIRGSYNGKELNNEDTITLAVGEKMVIKASCDSVSNDDFEFYITPFKYNGDYGYLNTESISESGLRYGKNADITIVGLKEGYTWLRISSSAFYGGNLYLNIYVTGQAPGTVFVPGNGTNADQGVSYPSGSINSTNELNSNDYFEDIDVIELTQYQSVYKTLSKNTNSGKVDIEIEDNSLISMERVLTGYKITGNDKTGTTNVTLTYYPNNSTSYAKKTITVKVKEWVPKYWELYSSQKIDRGGSLGIRSYCGFPGLEGLTCIASSSNNAIATVVKDHSRTNKGEDGFDWIIYGHGNGTATISFNYYVNDNYIGSHSCNFTVGTGINNSTTTTTNRTTPTITSPTYPLPSGYVSSNSSMGKEPITYSINNRTSFMSASYPLYLYSNDGKVFLGKITLNKYDSKSIFYEYGKYGSKYEMNSIWNEYGVYGGSYSDKSPFNSYATKPPAILDSKGRFVGYLTTNKYIINGYNILEVTTYLEKYE